MSVFVQQLPALLGLLVDALATYAATSAAEKGEVAAYRRSDGMTKRLIAYAQYAHAVKKTISITVRLAAHRGIHPKIDPLDAGVGEPALAAAQDERTVKWKAVLLLGTEEIVDAARAWHESAFRMQRIVAGSTRRRRGRTLSGRPAVRGVASTPWPGGTSVSARVRSRRSTSGSCSAWCSATERRPSGTAWPVPRPRWRGTRSG